MPGGAQKAIDMPTYHQREREGRVFSFFPEMGSSMPHHSYDWRIRGEAGWETLTLAIYIYILWGGWRAGLEGMKGE